MADLGDIVRKHLRFLKALPRVKPYFPVKCNSSGEVLRLLAELGAGFACANKVGTGWDEHPQGARGRAAQLAPIPRFPLAGTSSSRGLPLLSNPATEPGDPCPGWSVTQARCLCPTFLCVTCVLAGRLGWCRVHPWGAAAAAVPCEWL